jgi:flagellar hook-basal body complex protein FliE
MVERIGKESALAREALRAAVRHAASRAELEAPRAGEQAAPAAEVDFERALARGVERVDAQVRTAENLPVDLLTGKVDDFHELAVQLKSAELSFKFAMEIRNKLIDAYREIMRMSV